MRFGRPAIASTIPTTEGVVLDPPGPFPATNPTARRAALAVGALAVLVHLGALANGYAYDDLVLIMGDPGLQHLSGLLERLYLPSWPDLSGEEIGAWRPATTGTWALVWIASHGSPVAFHALGVLLHGVAAGLGVLILAELMPVAGAAVAGALFAVHPVHVEAIANVAGTAELIAAVWATLAVLVHLRGRETYGLGRVLAVTLLYTMAVLAKEGAAVTPLLLFLLDGARRDTDLPDVLRYVRERGVLYGALTLALAMILLLRLDVLGSAASATHPPGAEILRTAPRSWTVFSSWPHYVRLLFFPATLAADYGPRVVPIVFHWSPEAVLGAALGAIAFVGAWTAWRRGPALGPERNSARLAGLGVLWIAAAMLPVANVLYLGPVIVAERTFYVASWGAVMIAAWAFLELGTRRPRAAVGLLAAGLLGGAARSATRVPVWDSSEAVMDALVDSYGESGTGWMYLGQRLASEGRPAEALRAFTYATFFLNSEYRPSTELASHLLAMNRPEAAAFFLRRAWREHPSWPTAPGLLAAAELNAGHPERALPAARAATLIRPQNASMHHLLAQALAGTGDWSAAVAARRASLRTGFADRPRTWMLLAADLAALGDTTLAVAALDSAALRETTEEDRAALDELRRMLGDRGTRARDVP